MGIIRPSGHLLQERRLMGIVRPSGTFFSEEGMHASARIRQMRTNYRPLTTDY